MNRVKTEEVRLEKKVLGSNSDMFFWFTLFWYEARRCGFEVNDNLEEVLTDLADLLPGLRISILKAIKDKKITSDALDTIMNEIYLTASDDVLNDPNIVVDSFISTLDINSKELQAGGKDFIYSCLRDIFVDTASGVATNLITDKFREYREKRKKELQMNPKMEKEFSPNDFDPSPFFCPNGSITEIMRNYHQSKKSK